MAGVSRLMSSYFESANTPTIVVVGGGIVGLAGVRSVRPIGLAPPVKRRAKVWF